VDAGHDVSVFHRGDTESNLLPAVRHIHDHRAGIPILEFPTTVLELDAEVVIHMICMGEADADAAASTFAGRVERIVWLSKNAGIRKSPAITLIIIAKSKTVRTMGS